MTNEPHNIWSSHQRAASVLSLQYRAIRDRHQGSYKNNQSTGGFLSFQDGFINLGENYGFTGVNEVPVHPSENLPYCGKIRGVDGTVSTTNLLCERFGITKGTVTHDGIDNAAVLRNIFGPDEPDTTTPCFHLIKRAQRKIAESPVIWIGKKVKAHQDDIHSYDQLIAGQRLMLWLISWQRTIWYEFKIK